jgi:23S rRNA pseudouridine2457 synthase
MVQHQMNETAFLNLKEGVRIKIKNGEDYIAKPYSIFRVTDPVSLYQWATDAREAYPHTWLLITLTEGKYRQVRKMTLAVKHRCLRLIRLSIENITIEGISPGAIKELSRETFYQLAGIK